MTTTTYNFPTDETPAGEGAVVRCDEPVSHGLTCLERPRFQPGQVLSADDLGAGVDYGDARFALRRHLAGVGIVSGLHVHCHRERPGTVVIDPGYAIGPGGEDLVVCEPLCIDVCHNLPPSSPTQPGADFCGTEAPSDTIRYTLRLVSSIETASEVAVLPDRTGSGASELLPARERIVARPCLDPTAEVWTSLGDREHDFRAVGSGIIEQARLSLRDADREPTRSERSRAIGTALLVSIHRDPPRYYCGLAAEIREALQLLGTDPEPNSHDDEIAGETLARAFCALIDDQRIAFLADRDDGSLDRPGVRVAELWIDTSSGACSSTSCAIVAIDGLPPAREELHSVDPWRSSTAVSLYDAYFRDVREAYLMLSARGLRVRDVELSRFRPGRSERDDESEDESDRDRGDDVREGLHYGWLQECGWAAEHVRMSEYQASSLYAPCGAEVELVTIEHRVVSIRLRDVLPWPRPWWQEHRAPSPSETSQAFIARTVSRRVPAPWSSQWRPRIGEPEALDVAIDGIGPKREMAVWAAGILTLDDLVDAGYIEVRQALRGVRGMKVSNEEYQRWCDEAWAVISDPATRRRIDAEYGDDARRRYREQRKV